MITPKRLISGDVLRVLAVLSVLINHFNEDFFEYGYLGVDAFFVLSGYVVLRSLYLLKADNNFKILEFYARRINRLYPPYLITIFVIFLIALLTRSKPYLDDLAIELASSAIYLANVYFWQTFNYFSPDSSQSLSIHLWSLSVEEQYYLILPILLVLLSRIVQPLRIFIVLIIFTCSLALYFYGWHERSGVAAFYLLPFRAWQFILGGFFCHLAYKAYFSSAYLLFAILLLVFTLIFAKDAVLLRVWLSLCIAIILYSDDWLTNKKLVGFAHGKQKIVQTLANTTYFVYLLHQPLLVTWKRLGYLDRESNIDLVISIVVIWLLAHIFTLGTNSIFFSDGLRTKKNIKSMFIISTFIVVALSIGIRVTPAYIFHDNDQLKIISDRERNISYLRSSAYARGVCFLDFNQTTEALESNSCLKFDGETGTPLLVIGDSEAAHLMPGLRNIAKNHPPLFDDLLHASSASCVPIKLDINSRCRNYYSYVIEEIDFLCGKLDSLVILFSINWWGTIQRFGFEQSLSDLKLFLNGISDCARVFLFAEAADFLLDPYIEALDQVSGDTDLYIRSHDKTDVMRLMGFLISSTSAEIIRFGIRGIDGADKFIDNGKYLYFDRGHLSEYGSAEVAKEIFTDLGLKLNIDHE